LGLSQVYGFVKQSGGHLKIYSELGEGTTVKIYLPRLIGAVPVKDRRKICRRRSAISAWANGYLSLKDDNDVRNYVVDALRGLNYNVSEAPDAVRALALIEDQQFDLLLTDVVLPGMNGRSLPTD